MRTRSKPRYEQLNHAANALQIVVDRAGGVIGLSKMLGVSRQTVSTWVRRGYISATKAQEAAEIAGITREELRPDVLVWY